MAPTFPDVQTPHVAIMTLHFQVYGCATPRDKKRVFLPMLQNWGKATDLAVAEIGDPGDMGGAIWTVVTAGANPARLQQRLQQVEQEIVATIDAPVVDTHFEIT